MLYIHHNLATNLSLDYAKMSVKQINRKSNGIFIKSFREQQAIMGAYSSTEQRLIENTKKCKSQNRKGDDY